MSMSVQYAEERVRHIKLLKPHLTFLLLVNTCSSTSKLDAFIDVHSCNLPELLFHKFPSIYILIAECQIEHFNLVLVPKMREVFQEKGSLQPVHLGLLFLPLVVHLMS